MDQHLTALTGHEDLTGDYGDDFIDLSDDADLPLPGLHVQPVTAQWAAGGDWRLPGVVEQSAGSCSSRSSGTADGDGAGRSSWAGRGARVGACAGVGDDGGLQGGSGAGEAAAAARFRTVEALQDPWLYQMATGALYSTGLEQPFAQSNTLQRRTPTPTLRSSGFSPLSTGSGSIRQRDAPQPAAAATAAAAAAVQQHPPQQQARQQLAASPAPPPTPPPRQQLQNQANRIAAPPHHQPPAQPQPAQLHPRSRRYDVLAVAAAPDRTRGPDAAGASIGAAAGAAGAGGNGPGWPFTGADPFTGHVLSSSCSSSSSSSSRNASPVPLSPAPINSSAGHAAGPPPWYDNALFEHQSQGGRSSLGRAMGLSVGLGMGLGVGLGGLGMSMSHGIGGGGGGDGGGGRGGGGALSAEIDGRPFGMGPSRHGMSAYSAGLGPASAALTRRPDTAGSSRSSRPRSSSSDNSDASWVPSGAGRFGGARAGGGGGGGGHLLPLLWPAGGGGGGGRGGGRSETEARSSAGGGGGGLMARGSSAGRWRAVPGELPAPSHAAGGGGGTMGSRWPPSVLGESAERSSMTGLRSPQGSGAAELSWDHRYGVDPGGGRYGFSAGPGAAGLGGLGLGGGTAGRGRYSPRSSLAGGSGLGGGGGLTRIGSMSAVRGGDGSGLRPSLSGGLGLGNHYREVDSFGVGAAASRAGGDDVGGTSFGSGGGGGGGGGLRIYATIDGPGGPYERRRVLLASSSRGVQPGPLDSPVAPAVRQYGDGLAGVLTNTQIQEWMSQHASRLLLPRHMQEIADIVFRPPSAVTDKRPPKCHPGSAPAAALPPPVILGGRYPPLHVSRMVGDPAFVSSLLAGLPGVDPGNARIQAVLTALQGREVVVAEEEDEETEAGPQAGQAALC